jgi:cell division septal protein FtsQ
MRDIPSNARNKRISSPRQRKQQHLLDVKIRESKERVRRYRAITGFVCKVVLFAGLAAGAWIGGKEALRRFVWENPDYYISEINFATDGALTREQVLSAAGIVENRNIFTVDLSKARSIVEQMPQVESAIVQRQLPNRMSVTVTERRPIAWVAAKGDEDPSSSERSFLIDARGIVLRSRVVLPEYYHLPIISGFETENLVPGKRVSAWEMQAALELVSLNADNTRFQARNIDLSKGYCLVVTDQRRAKITFGLDNIDKQLTRLNRYLDRAAEDRREIQTVNLIVERNVPVTFYEPEPVTPPTEKVPVAEPAKPVPPVADKMPVRKAEVVKKNSTDTSKKPDAAPSKSSSKSTPSSRSSGAKPVKKPFRLNP